MAEGKQLWIGEGRSGIERGKSKHARSQPYLFGEQTEQPKRGSCPQVEKLSGQIDVAACKEVLDTESHTDTATQRFIELITMLVELFDGHGFSVSLCFASI